MIETTKLSSMRFLRNVNGHIVIEIEGLGLTGDEEIDRLLYGGYKFDDWAEYCVRSTDYDINHRLEDHRTYTVALIPVSDAGLSDRKVDTLRRYGEETFGYQKPPAGLIMRLRELLSNDILTDMHFQSGIVVAHDPIENNESAPVVLTVDPHDGGHWISSRVFRSSVSSRSAVAFIDINPLA